MTDFTLQSAQADMRRAYLSGAPGVLISGLVWLASGGVAAMVSEKASVMTLLFGGAAIFPMSIVITKLLGRSGKHMASNPLGSLAAEGTIWLLAGCAVAYGMHLVRMEWFFPSMLLAIGGRYLTFQTLYGLRAYWACGGLLCVAALALALSMSPPIAGALTGAAIELVFAAVLFRLAKRAPQ
jgi:hypothetical protein